MYLPSMIPLASRIDLRAAINFPSFKNLNQKLRKYYPEMCLWHKSAELLNNANTLIQVSRQDIKQLVNI